MARLPKAADSLFMRELATICPALRLSALHLRPLPSAGRQVRSSLFE